MQAKYQFQVFPSSGVPIFRQLIDQILALISSGKLEENNVLPSVRQMAAELEINPMTVSKAYSLLEQQDVLELVRGKGMRVKKRTSIGTVAERKAQARAHFEQAISRSYQLSLTKNDVLDILKPMLAALKSRKTRKEKIA